MVQPAFDPPLTPRERLRWRRARDVVLVDAIFGRVRRDAEPARPERLLCPDALAGVAPRPAGLNPAGVGTA